MEAGCVAGQGFFFARPVDASAVTKLLAGAPIGMANGAVSAPRTTTGPKRGRRATATAATP